MQREKRTMKKRSVQGTVMSFNLEEDRMVEVQFDTEADIVVPTRTRLHVITKAVPIEDAPAMLAIMLSALSCLAGLGAIAFTTPLLSLLDGAARALENSGALTKGQMTQLVAHCVSKLVWHADVMREGLSILSWTCLMVGALLYRPSAFSVGVCGVVASFRWITVTYAAPVFTRLHYTHTSNDIPIGAWLAGVCGCTLARYVVVCMCKGCYTRKLRIHRH